MEQKGEIAKMTIRPGETYIGDGLYASFEDSLIKLRAPRGRDDHVVYLEPLVWDALLKLVAERPPADKKVVHMKPFPNTQAAVGKRTQLTAEKSWYCEQCCVEVYQFRCPHCGKTKRERT